MKEFLFITLLFILAFVACSRKINSKEATTIPEIMEEEQITQLAKETFKNNYSLQYNKSKTIICISKSFKTRPNDIFSTLSFILYNPKTKTVLFKEAIPKASGKWISNHEFEVISMPGRLNPNTKNKMKRGFVYDVMNKIKRKL